MASDGLSMIIAANFAVEPCECDGSECMACGDTIYLRQFELVAKFTAGVKLLGKISTHMLCAGCAEEINKTVFGEKPNSL